MNQELIIKERIEKLRKTINYHRYLYHVLDKQILSDGALDSLKQELKKLEDKYPKFITFNSPTKRIGGVVLDKFIKVKHKVRQWSLEDAFTKTDLLDWEKRLKKILSKNTIDYACELKIDGLHIALNYEKGIFVLGETRGNGILGENVTENLKTIEAIPLMLEKDINITVEGEVFIKKSDFEKLNKAQKQKGLNLFANPRNAAAGAIRQLDTKITAERPLDCFVYDYVWPENDIPETQIKELIVLKNLGFKVNKYWKHCKNINEVIDFWHKWAKKCDTLDYWIDGIVIKVNKKTLRNKLGYTGKAPRFAIAAKFPSEEKTTKILNIEFGVGRTGKITPVAIMDPILLKGTIVTRATLHNFDEIKRLDIRINDTVVVTKAGEIIPKIKTVIKELRTKETKKINIPKKCPVCLSAIIKKENKVDYYCKSKNCAELQAKKIIYFVSKKAFDISGLGDRIVEKLLNEGLISDASDLFKLKEIDLIPLEKFAEKKAKNIISAIEKSKKIPLWRFLVALGIRGIGEQNALLLEKFFADLLEKNSITRLSSAILNNLNILLIKGIGPEITQNIKIFFKDKKNIEILKKLNKAGIKIVLPKVKLDSKLNGKTFVFTGAMENIGRDEAQKKVIELGGKISNSIGKNTDYLVLGENPGSKFKKAKNLKIKTINEKEFLKLINYHL
ncbi:MAG: NAD-dependent DNA ligase LigA [Patescibacteria group bacterium]